MDHIHSIRPVGDVGIHVEGRHNSPIYRVKGSLESALAQFFQRKGLEFGRDQPVVPKANRYEFPVFSPQRQIATVAINSLRPRSFDRYSRADKSPHVDYPVAPSKVTIQNLQTYFNFVGLTQEARQRFSHNCREEFMGYVVPLL